MSVLKSKLYASRLEVCFEILLWSARAWLGFYSHPPPPSWPPVNRSPGTVLTQDKLLTELSLLLLGRSSSKGWERQTDRQTDRHWHYRQWRNEFRQRQADCQTMWQNRWQTGCQTDNESMEKLASEKTDRLPNRHGQECSEDVPEISLVHQTWSGMFRRCARNLLGPPWRHGQECSEDVPEISFVHQTWSGMFRRCARNLLCSANIHDGNMKCSLNVVKNVFGLLKAVRNLLQSSVVVTYLL